MDRFFRTGADRHTAQEVAEAQEYEVCVVDVVSRELDRGDRRRLGRRRLRVAQQRRRSRWSDEGSRHQSSHLLKGRGRTFVHLI